MICKKGKEERDDEPDYLGKAGSGPELPPHICNSPSRNFRQDRTSIQPLRRRGRFHPLEPMAGDCQFKSCRACRSGSGKDFGRTDHVRIEREEAFAVEYRLDETCNGRKCRDRLVMVLVPLKCEPISVSMSNPPSTPLNPSSRATRSPYKP